MLCAQDVQSEQGTDVREMIVLMTAPTTGEDTEARNIVSGM